MQPRLATSTAPPPELWGIRVQAIAWFVLVVAFVLGLPILLGWTLVLGVLFAAPFYYLMVITDTRPATVPQVALNNSSKRVDPAFAKAHANDFQPKPATNDNAFMLKAVEWSR